MSTSNPRKLVSIREGAESIGVDDRTFRRYIASGDIPAYRLPGRRLIRVDINEIEAALKPVPNAALGAVTPSGEAA